MPTKVCTCCATEKPTTEYYKHKVAADGLHTECKCCFKVRMDARYKASDAYHEAQFDKVVRQWSKGHKARRKAEVDGYRKTYYSTMRKARSAEASRHSSYKEAGYKHDDSYDHLNCIAYYWLRDELAKVTGVAHEVDHIVPCHAGGTHTHTNLQVLPVTGHLHKTLSERN